MSVDIRWQQRFDNYRKALAQLERSARKEGLNFMEEQGLIKCFEYTYELGWNTIKDIYEYQGESNIQGSRDAIQMAFKRGLIADGAIWMNMLKDRNRTAHAYNEKTASEISANILSVYLGAFIQLRDELGKMVQRP
jgi:nucleotidyltransferase substrate binding protein (TIGR01987 family)